VVVVVDEVVVGADVVVVVVVVVGADVVVVDEVVVVVCGGGGVVPGAEVVAGTGGGEGIVVVAPAPPLHAETTRPPATARAIHFLMTGERMGAVPLPAWSELVSGSHPRPTRKLRTQVEMLDDSSFRHLVPGGTGEHPHDLELVAIRVGAVDALRCSVRRLTSEGTGVADRGAECGELVDGVHLPGEVAQARLALYRTRASHSEGEQPEVVVVARIGRRQERGIHPLHGGHHGEAQYLGVELQGAVEIGHEQHRVIEPTDPRRHGQISIAFAGVIFS